MSSWSSGLVHDLERAEEHSGGCDGSDEGSCAFERQVSEDSSEGCYTGVVGWPNEAWISYGGGSCIAESRACATEACCATGWDVICTWQVPIGCPKSLQG